MLLGEIKNACNTEMEEVPNNYGGACTDGGKNRARHEGRRARERRYKDAASRL